MIMVVVRWICCFVCFGFVFRKFAQQYYAQQVWKCLIELCCRGCIRSVWFEQRRSLQIHVNHSRCHLVFMPCRSPYPPAVLQRSGVVTWIPLFVIPSRSWGRGATVCLPFRVRGRQRGWDTRICGESWGMVCGARGRAGFRYRAETRYVKEVAKGSRSLG
jgi:hypothetical protein